MPPTDGPGTRVAPALLVAASEAARLLGISTRTLWTLTDQGEIPAVRIGRSVRYRPESLRRYAQAREEKARPTKEDRP